MNNEKKQAPRCPYCGTEMQCDSEEYITGGGYAVYGCPKCRAMSPIKEDGASFDKAISDAYVAATKHWQEPNRLLTLEEICTAEVCWTETPRASLEACRIVMREYTSFPEGKPVKSFDFYSTGETVPWCYRPEEYGVSVRCWLRKPTPEEMANTPWEENQK